jgi:hypothetical protein
MNQYVAKILQEAGWHKSRNIDISEQEKILNEEGYYIFESAKQFLSEYDELTIKYLQKIDEDDNAFCFIKIIDLNDTININVIEAAREIFISTVKKYEKYLSVKLIPVAEARRRNVIVCISEDGRFFGFYGGVCIVLGNSFIEVLENLSVYKTYESLEVKHIDFDDEE